MSNTERQRFIRFFLAGAFAARSFLALGDSIPTVEVKTLAPEPIYDALTYPAKLSPRIDAKIIADSDGIVKSISRHLGEIARKNQIIMTLKQIVPGLHYEPNNALAPLQGVVSSIDVSEGTRVTKGQQLATITDPSRLKILVELAVTDLPSVREGMAGTLKLSGSPEAIPVKVRGISPLIDQVSGTATCELGLGDRVIASELPAGFVGKVSFRAHEHHGLQVPEDAVVYRDRGPFLRVVVDGKVAYRAVTLGETRQGKVEIVSGAQSGQVVIVRSSAFLVEGDPVKAQTAGGD
jgi:multidrug efflux pump subunit AcrA (membrane-fusion protein)